MAFALVVVDVVGGDTGEAEVAREVDECFVAGLVFVHEVVLELDEEVFAAEDRAVAVGGFPSSAQRAGFDQAGDFTFAAAGKGYEAFGVLGQPLEATDRLTPG